MIKKYFITYLIIKIIYSTNFEIVQFWEPSLYEINLGDDS